MRLGDVVILQIVFFYLNNRYMYFNYKLCNLQNVNGFYYIKILISEKNIVSLKMIVQI